MDPAYSDEGGTSLLRHLERRQIVMSSFDKQQALARYIELMKQRYAEFTRLPDFRHRVACGDYEFFSSVDNDLDELRQETNRNGFYVQSTWDGQKLVDTIESMSPEEFAVYLAEEQGDGGQVNKFIN